jgi:uncharacterized protein YndB with AHSA1/START domain
VKRVLLALALLIVVAIAGVWLVGLALPVEHVASQSMWIAAPRDSVWRAITGVREFPEWRRNLDSVVVLDDAVAWREFGGFGAITFRADELQPTERFVARITDPDLGFGGRWIYTLSDSAGGTTISITEEGEVLNPMFRTISRFVTGHDATMAAFLEDLSAHLR